MLDAEPSWPAIGGLASPGAGARIGRSGIIQTGIVQNDLSIAPPARRHPGAGAHRPDADVICATARHFTARIFDIPDVDMRRATPRGRDTVLARQTAMYLANVGAGVSFSDVGRSFRRDRTTVAHACGRIEDLRDDPAWDLPLTLIEGALRAMLRMPDLHAPLQNGVCPAQTQNQEPR